MDYWKKQAIKPLFENILWNLPEQKTGAITIIGGNSQNFSTEIKNAELLSSLNLKDVKLIFPDSLKSKLPPLPNINFTPATSSGSFEKSPTLLELCNNTDYLFYSGDFSKNSATSVAIADTIIKSSVPCLITRDTIDLILSEMNNIITRNNLTIVGSMAQLQKIFRSIYYPKMLLLSMPIMPVIEILHKFTISYPVNILTFHQDQIITAKNGVVITTPINQTSFSPISLWSGSLASKISALILWNHTKALEATTTAIFWNHRQSSMF